MTLEKRLTAINKIKLRLTADILNCIASGSKINDTSNYAKERIKEYIPTANEILSSCSCYYAEALQQMFYDNLTLDNELFKFIK